MKKILIIEDDQKLNEGIKLALYQPDYHFVQAYLLDDAREILRQEEMDLILLDVNLPDGNGMDLLKQIRTKSMVPVIIITANNTETDIVVGLEAGANDYITKPFSLMVLRARASVQLREKKDEKKVNYYMDNRFSFDFDKMEYLVEGRPVELSRTEQKLLHLFIENKGATLKRSYLIDAVWSGDTEYVEEHALTVAIKRLRDKLERDSAHPEYLSTIYGIGYTWEIKE